MKLRSVHAENFRAIRSLTVLLDPALTVLHGNNAHGKTSVLAAIAVGLGTIPTILAGRGGINFRKSDRRSDAAGFTWVDLDAWDTLDGAGAIKWRRYHLDSRMGTLFPPTDRGTMSLREYITALATAVDHSRETTIPVIAFYDTDRAVFDIPERKRGFQGEFHRFNTYIDALARKN